MEAIFLKILNMSITASWLVLAVLLLRLVLKKAPKAISCALWTFVGVRLLFPLALPSVLSLIPSSETIPPNITTALSPSIDSGVSAINEVINPILSGSFTPDPSNSVTPLQIVTAVASALWVAGMAVMLIYTCISYLRLRLRIREAVPVRDNIWICDHVDIPFILGVFRPRIYLPSALCEEDADYVIAHEQAHLKRFDHVWKPLGFMLLTIHWFNPLLWIGYVLLCRDIELSCDEKVIKAMGTERKKSYSAALINCSMPRHMIAACPLAFGEVSVESRIKSVLNYKKPAFWLVVAAVAVLLAVGICFLTDPITSMRISDIDDAGHNGQIFDEVLSVRFLSLYTGYGYYLSANNGVTEKLSGIRLDRKPISQSRAEDRDRTHQVILNDNTAIYINTDFTELWIDDGIKPSYSYRIQNSEYVEELFIDYIPSGSFSPQSRSFSNAGGTLKNGNSYFCATVLEFSPDHILVEPLEGTRERRSADRITVWINSLAEGSIPPLKTGDIVRIEHAGVLLEVYPALIGKVYDITVVDIVKITAVFP